MLCWAAQHRPPSLLTPFTLYGGSDFLKQFYSSYKSLETQVGFILWVDSCLFLTLLTKSFSSHSFQGNIWDIHKVLQRGNKLFYNINPQTNNKTVSALIGPPNFNAFRLIAGRSYFCMLFVQTSALTAIKVVVRFGCWRLAFRLWEFSSMRSDLNGI